VTRLAPVPRDQWDDDVRDALRAGFGEATATRLLADGMPNVVGTLMHHPRLAGPFLAYNTVLLTKPALDPRLRELAVLRVAHRTTCSYEWAQHARMADRVGISRDEVAAVRDGTFDGLEADVLAAVDQCVDDACIDDETWARLASQLDETQLVELVFVIGTYAGLAMAFNSFGLQLDAELKEFEE
jgi:4-carboxymuconolactone decarboxylase